MLLTLFYSFTELVGQLILGGIMLSVLLFAALTALCVLGGSRAGKWVLVALALFATNGTARAANTGELSTATATQTGFVVNDDTPMLHSTADVTLSSLASGTTVIVYASLVPTAQGGTSSRWVGCTIADAAATDPGSVIQDGGANGNLSLTDAPFPFETQYVSTTDLHAISGLGVFTNVSGTKTFELWCDINVNTKSTTFNVTLTAIALKSTDGQGDITPKLAAFQATPSGTFDTETVATAYNTDSTNNITGAAGTVNLAASQPVLVIGHATMISSSGSGARDMSVRAVYCSGTTACNDAGTGVTLAAPAVSADGTATDSEATIATVGVVTPGAGDWYFELEKKTDNAARGTKAYGQATLLVIPLKNSTTGVTYPYAAVQGGSDTVNTATLSQWETTSVTNANAPSTTNNGKMVAMFTAHIGPAAGAGTHAFTSETRVRGSAVLNQPTWLDWSTTARYVPFWNLGVSASISANQPHAIDLYASADTTKTVALISQSLVGWSLIPDQSTIPTPTPTNTNTPTATATNTVTPTFPYGTCTDYEYTINAVANDGFTQSINNAAATLDTASAVVRAGKWNFGSNLEEDALLAWDITSLPNTATVTDAWLELNISQVSEVGTANRQVNAKWTTFSNPWVAGDHEDTISSTTAFTTDPSNLRVTNPYRITLSNAAANIDPTGTWAAMKIGVDGGDPSGSDYVLVIFEGNGTATPTPPVGTSSRAKLIVRACLPTPTPTNTPTNTPTDTPTATPTDTPTVTHTPTETPITPPFRMPDVTGPTPGVPDGVYGLALDGSDLFDMVWGTGSDNLLLAKVRDPDGICSYIRTAATSADVAARQEALSSPECIMPGACIAAGRCARLATDATGTVKRGLDTVADIVAIDIGAAYREFTGTWTANRVGVCHGGPDNNNVCRVNAPSGQFTTGGNARCIAGLGLGSSCTAPGIPPAAGPTPVPCIGDAPPNSNDPRTSYCQPNVWSVSDQMNVTGCRAPGLCQERARISAVKNNVRRAIDGVLKRKAIPLVLMPYLPAKWTSSLGCASTVSLPVQTLPTAGHAVPITGYMSPAEVAFCELSHLNSWAHLMVDNYRQRSTPTPKTTKTPQPTPTPVQLPWIDFDRLASISHGVGQRETFLGDTVLAASEGKGKCTCVTDSDCPGSTCTGGKYCAGGTRGTCAWDWECAGSSSQAIPGTAWCIGGGESGNQLPSEAISAAFRACLEDWSLSADPYWTALGILNCSAPRIPMNPAFKTWPPYTMTPTPTRTITLTPTSTVPGAPTSTSTPPAATSTNTPAVSPTPVPGSLSNKCAADPVNPLVCDKIGPTIFRSLYNWATWIDPDSRGYGYVNSPGPSESGVTQCQLGEYDTGQCKIDLGFHSASRISTIAALRTNPPFDNELMCNQKANTSSSTCSYDITTNTKENAGTGKFTQGALGDNYAGLDCTQADWDKVWLWTGDPDMPKCGYCDDFGTTADIGKYNYSVTTGSCPCKKEDGSANSGGTNSKNCDPATGTYYTTCPVGATKVPKCDQLRFGSSGLDPAAGSDPPSYGPLGNRIKPLNDNTYAWESVRCYQEIYEEPIGDEILSRLRAITLTSAAASALSPAGVTGQHVTDRCAERALNQFFTNISKNLPNGACVGQCTNTGPSVPAYPKQRYCTYQSDCVGAGLPTCTNPAGCCNINSACLDKLDWCMRTWIHAGLQGTDDCGTCAALGPPDAEGQSTCDAPADVASCPTAQISCAEMRSWCDYVIGAIAPIRYGCRQVPRPGYE